MKDQKIHTQEKKLLYQLEGIIKTLYPNLKTTNPYQHYLQHYFDELEIEDLLLFNRLLKSITIINHKERILENKRYISTYADVLTVIELLSRHRINDILLQSYVNLKDIFGDNTFTKLQASRVLRKSYRTVEQYIELWKHLQLVEKTNLRKGAKHLYRLLQHKAEINIEEELF